jgi:hypothetical protein
MVVIFKSYLLQVDGIGVVVMWKGGAVRPSLRRCLAVSPGLSMSDDEDVGGLHLVGAWHSIVFLVGGHDDLHLPRQQSKW